MNNSGTVGRRGLRFGEWIQGANRNVFEDRGHASCVPLHVSQFHLGLGLRETGVRFRHHFTEVKVRARVRLRHHLAEVRVRARVRLRHRFTEVMVRVRVWYRYRHYIHK